MLAQKKHSLSLKKQSLSKKVSSLFFLESSMDSNGTHQQHQQNHQRPTSTPQAKHQRPTVGVLSLRKPQQPLMLEQRGRKYAPPPPDVIDLDSDGNADSPAKRGRGRPPGSRNKQRNESLEEEGGRSITTHVIKVNAGEDIATSLVVFMSQEPREACILSASGTVSSAALKSNTSIGVVNFEGRYDIMRMSGILSNTESNGTVTITRNLSVSLAGRDGKIFGGCVGRMLVAGSQVMVIVGSFVPERVEVSAASAPGFSQSQGPQCPSESSEENGSESPVDQVENSTPQPPHHLHF
ncbi:unnamed protein product [Eruca vesicaria subsp. sativa]|uniref:AT-hook motif nuclear-localized protein n=1 Tax=Eruca vesicaria subsp. sativa TaxID=29727 RepID=A0ABC8LD03_ERUVS|nr:unnamed protein product [Eruca vesicaria subsp. sativa]